jgi:hypothetical protein
MTAHAGDAFGARTPPGGSHLRHHPTVQTRVTRTAQTLYSGILARGSRAA